MGNGVGGLPNKNSGSSCDQNLHLFPHDQVLDLNFFTSTSVLHFSQRVEGTLGHYRWNLLGGHEGLVLVLDVFPKNPWVIPWAQLVEGTFGAITWYVPIRQ